MFSKLFYHGTFYEAPYIFASHTLKFLAFAVNRFERPQMNNNSKQALSNLLRQRQPPFVGGNQMANNPGNFNAMQQQRQGGMQPQQVPSQMQNPQSQQFMRNQIRGMAPNQMIPGGPMSGGNVAGNVPGMNSNMVGPNGNMNASQMMMQQNQQNMVGGQQPGGQSSNQSLNQGMGQGMMNAGGSMGIGQQQAGMMQQGMMGNQSQQQFQNYNNFNNPAMGNQPGGGGGAPGSVPVQQNMMSGSNFNQMNAQSTNQVEYMARQRVLQQQQQQQTNRGQYINQTPNITMSNMMNQGGAPPYQRQGSAGGGKPTVSQQQQFSQQQRLRQQQMMMQGIESLY